MEDTQPKAKKTKKKTKPAKKGLAGLSERMESRKKSRNTLNKDLEVEVMNITSGKVFHRCPKTNQVIEMAEFGDTEVMTMEQLNAMKNRERKTLENFWMVITDVYSDEVEIDDVLDALRLSSIYNGMRFDENVLDNVIIELTFEEFEEIIHEMKPQLVLRVAERMKVLLTKGQFGDMYKMDYIANLIGKPDLFVSEPRR